jgi:RNA polymerase sigma factor (sigma-70 family)
LGRKEGHSLKKLSDTMTFEEFVEKYRALIYKMSYKFFLKDYTFDDIFQEIMFIAWRVYNGFIDDGRSSLITYFTSAIYRDMSVFIEKQKKHQYVDFEEIDRVKEFGAEDTSEKDLEQEKIVEEVWEFVSSIPKSYRVRWYYLGGMTAKRIAEIEQTTAYDIRSYLKKVRKEITNMFPNLKEDWLR